MRHIADLEPSKHAMWSWPWDVNAATGDRLWQFARVFRCIPIALAWSDLQEEIRDQATDAMDGLSRLKNAPDVRYCLNFSPFYKHFKEDTGEVDGDGNPVYFIHPPTENGIIWTNHIEYIRGRIYEMLTNLEIERKMERVGDSIGRLFIDHEIWVVERDANNEVINNDWNAAISDKLHALAAIFRADLRGVEIGWYSQGANTRLKSGKKRLYSPYLIGDEDHDFANPFNYDTVDDDGDDWEAYYVKRVLQFEDTYEMYLNEHQCHWFNPAGDIGSPGGYRFAADVPTISTWRWADMIRRRGHSLVQYAGPWDPRAGSQWEPHAVAAYDGLNGLPYTPPSGSNELSPKRAVDAADSTPD